MHVTWTKFVTLAVLILLLSACVTPQVTTRSPSTSQPPNITKMRLLFMGDDETKWREPLEVHAVLMDENDLRKTLGILISGDIPKLQNLGELIRLIRTTNERAEGQVPRLTGLGGVYGHALLDLAAKALSDGAFNTLQQVIVSVFGQITHYEFHQNPQNPTTGNGALEVITYVTSETVLPGQGVIMLQTEAYRWKVRVVNDGFQIVQHSGNANDPFPNTMVFTPEMLARVQVRGYMYKLWAKGTVIKIDLIEKRQGTNWIPLSKTDPQYTKLYAEVDENCIDMMFVQAPPASLGGMKPPLYCLGRCQNPMIVNTGE
jgi:hypothetical protein